jgi:hypothetical protein
LESTNLNELSVDEPEGGRFGKVLFGSQRKDDVEKEPDTTEEEEIFWAIENHYNENNDKTLEASAERIIDLAKSGKYKNILQPPNGFVYRIVRVNKEHAEKFFGLPKETMEEEMYGYKDTSQYAARKDSKIQSWSFKPNADVLSDFVSPNPAEVTIMFKAKCPEGGKFFMNPYGISNLKLIGKWNKEKEVISHGPIKIQGAAYFCSNPFFKVEHDEVVVKLLKLCGER